MVKHILNSSIRILIAEDNLSARESLKDLLESIQGLEVVAQASTAEESITLCKQHRPHIVIMDLGMPQKSGIRASYYAGLEATRLIADACPFVRILIYSVHNENAFVADVIRWGVRGYVLKGADQDELIRAIEAVYAGDLFLGKEIAPKLQEILKNLSTPPNLKNIFSEFNLSKRECEVLELLSRNYTNEKISVELDIVEHTVRNYITAILDKLDCKNRVEAGEVYKRKLRQVGWNIDGAK